MNMHLPFNAERINGNLPQNQRDNMLNDQTKCFEDLYNYFIKLYNPDYVFVMGDLNYRVNPLDKQLTQIEQRNLFFQIPNIMSAPLTNQYESLRKHDELHTQLAQYQFQEGDNGPTFPMTCKMMKGRPSNCNSDPRRECYQMFTQKDPSIRFPSWCDRILYKTFNELPPIQQVEYEMYDNGIIKCSDHSAVYGIYKIPHSN
jgi:hypothetical protein